MCLCLSFFRWSSQKVKSQNVPGPASEQLLKRTSKNFSMSVAVPTLCFDIGCTQRRTTPIRTLALVSSMHVVHTCNRQPGLYNALCLTVLSSLWYCPAAYWVRVQNCYFPNLSLKRGGVEGLASSNGPACPSPGSAVPFLTAQQMLMLLLLIVHPTQHV